MALLAEQQVGVLGITPTFVAATSGGDTIAPDDNLILAIHNADGSAHTVTLVRPGTEYGQANPDVSLAVAAGATSYMAVPREFVDPATGLIGVTYSAVTSVTVALLRGH